MKNLLLNRLLISFLAVFILLPSQISAKIDAKEAHEIGVEAYIYLYPLVLMDITRKHNINYKPNQKQGVGPMNAFWNMRTYQTLEDRDVVRPNFDTLYSRAWIDLTDGPVIVSTPDTDNRYYLLPMMDMWTDIFAVPGKRTSGTKSANFVVVPPRWNGILPKGVERIDAPTPYVWIIGRTQTNGPEDYDAVHKVQEGYKITPLSQWGKEPKVTELKLDATFDMKTDPLKQVNKMSSETFFAYAAKLMKVHPPHITDWSTLERMKHIGIEAGQSFDLSKADPIVRAALEQATVDGLQAMKDKIPTLSRVANGWLMSTDSIGVYGDYYLKRAIVAMVGLGANQPEDAIYPLLLADANGKPLVGEENYVLHFDKTELPPVNAFWSVTMYDIDGFQIANPLNRFAVSSWMPFKYNADGSLDIYIQHESPGKEKESNWLPSPAAGTLGITMRLYAPKLDALTGKWNPPPVKYVTDKAMQTEQ